MKGVEAIVRVLKIENVGCLSCFPANSPIDADAAAGVRPIRTRAEGTLAHMADGYTRVSKGHRHGVTTVRQGRGSEKAFDGSPQAYAAASSILTLPGGAS